jgi:hypothetical protein
MTPREGSPQKLDYLLALGRDGAEHMLNVDLLISVGIWFSGVGMSAVGIEMTINPPTADSTGNKKWWYRSTFIVLGLAFIGLSIWQSDRLQQKEIVASSQHQTEQVRNEGNLKYMQGQLDSINKVLGTISGNNSPQQTAAILKSILPHIETDGKSALEKMSRKELRSKVLEFANQMRELSGRYFQQEENASLTAQAEMRTVSNDDKTKRDEMWNKSIQQSIQRSNQFGLDFKEQYLGSAVSYRDELLRRLGPQPPETGLNRPMALEGWIAPMSVDATAMFLEKLARNLPE